MTVCQQEQPGPQLLTPNSWQEQPGPCQQCQEASQGAGGAGGGARVVADRDALVVQLAAVLPLLDEEEECLVIEL